MKRLFGASLTIALAALFSTSLLAADLPEVKITAANKVPQCATPGRLMAYLRSRNPQLDPRFEGVATQYMRHGESLGLRWDIAFFQMILETGALRFSGDVRADQNNFAGLGASGGGAHGERFADLSSGVKAHLQHLLMYAGEHIDDPVAERTRKVQEWGVLTDWQKSINGPMTFTLVAQQWAPTSRNYVRDVATITDGFYSEFCNGADPEPGLVQEARQGRQPKTKAKDRTEVAAAAAPTQDESPAEAAPKVSGAEIAKVRIEEERKEGAPLKALGAGMLGSVSESAKAAAEPHQQSQDAPPVTLLNAKLEAEPQATAEVAPEAKAPAAKAELKADSKSKAKSETKSVAKADPKKPDAKRAEVQTASIGSAATQLKLPPAKSAGKCKVWTASYGGQRAVIIKANGTGTVNYTVLDVTDSNEKREVDAYIAAYAKGGEKVASFATQTKALNKAFELCPEG
jgi:Mannosyl-glycoprotein endo-beta-N-acetylglucosaminidase